MPSTPAAGGEDSRISLMSLGGDATLESFDQPGLSVSAAVNMSGVVPLDNTGASIGRIISFKPCFINYFSIRFLNKYLVYLYYRWISIIISQYDIAIRFLNKILNKIFQ